MSLENMEVVRRLVELWNERDVDAIAELWEPDGALYAWPESGPWHGRDAVMGEIRSLLENVGAQEVTVECIVAHADWVVVRQLWYVPAHRGGITGDVPSSTAVRLRDGKLVECRFYQEHADACKAAGLTK